MSCHRPIPVTPCAAYTRRDTRHLQGHVQRRHMVISMSLGQVSCFACSAEIAVKRHWGVGRYAISEYINNRLDNLNQCLKPNKEKNRELVATHLASQQIPLLASCRWIEARTRPSHFRAKSGLNFHVCHTLSVTIWAIRCLGRLLKLVCYMPVNSIRGLDIMCNTYLVQCLVYTCSSPGIL